MFLIPCVGFHVFAHEAMNRATAAARCDMTAFMASIAIVLRAFKAVMSHLCAYA